MKNTKAFAIAASVGLVGLVGASAYFVLAGRGSLSECGESRIVGGTAQIGGPFELVDGTTATVDDKDVIDKPSLIYFGYTRSVPTSARWTMPEMPPQSIFYLNAAWKSDLFSFRLTRTATRPTLSGTMRDCSIPRWSA